MAIPDFQSVMRPLMEFLADGQEHSLRESIEHLAGHFRLTADEQRVLLPSGRQELFKNRVAWAKAHLRMAGLIVPAARGIFQITPRGQALLKAHAGPIGLRELKRQPGYAEARDRKRDDANDPPVDTVAEQSRTPEELMEQAFEALRESLARDILSKLKASSPEPERFSWVGRACSICFCNSFVVRSLRASHRPAPRSLLGLQKHLLRNHFPPN
jgi:restriction system protein